MASSTRALTIADNAVLSALRVWSGTAGSRFWDGFEPQRRQVLRDGWSVVSELEPDALRDRLRREHQAEARPDLSRIHPSWWIRALKDESPAVQRAVAANAPRAIREPLRSGLGLTDADLQVDRPSQSDALAVALSLWSERLVGDWPDRDDPPVVAALTRHDLRDVTRLIQATGLAKHALAGMLPEGLRSRDRAWAQSLPRLTTVLPPRFEAQARADVVRYGGTGRHCVGRLGLVTIARLLDAAEPYRVRWALQHLPYSVAKFTRSLMTPQASHGPNLAAWESQLFDIARNRLRQEGRLRDERGGDS